jgi:hypothetical protein
VSKTFPVGPIPVTVSAGATGELGMTMALNGTLARKCPNPEIDVDSGQPVLDSFETDEFNMQASLEAAPYASVDVFASAKVDVLIASAGVRLDLTLLRLDLPLKMGVQLGFLRGNRDEIALQVDGTLDLTLRALDGRISVFVDTLFGNLVTETIFRWNGPRVTLPVTEVHLYHPLLDLRRKLEQGP